VTACLFLAVALLTGCQSFMLAQIDARKAPSLAPWRDRAIAGESARDYVLRRSAVLTSGCDGVVAQVTADRTAILRAADTSGGRGGGCGAVAITPDGYFLSAAHCVQDPPLMLYRFEPGEQAAVAVRLVALFKDDRVEGPDYALVHVDLATPAYAPLAETVPAGEPVICVGSGIGSSIFAAGSVTGEQQCLAGNVPVRIITHDAPLYLGDSGGPVFDPLGRLIGISVWSDFDGFSAPHAAAQLPDPAELRRIIDLDRATPHAGS
jgi:S1-C subfamily serine protease